MSLVSPHTIIDAMHAAFRVGDLDGIACHWSESVVYEAPGVKLSGYAARLEAEKVWLAAFSENSVQTHARFVNGEEVVDFATMGGRHTGPLALPGGHVLAPTGAMVSGPYAARYRIENNKVVAQQVIYDRLALLQSLGAMGATGAGR